jgi:hypothetical protein
MSPTVRSTTESEVPTAPRRRGEIHGWTLYVIDLQKKVFLKRAFEKANPGYIRGKPCVYVGLTVKTAEARYKEHKAGTRDGRFVKECGKRVRVNDGRCLRSMTRKRAEKKEAALALELRGLGWGVWSN